MYPLDLLASAIIEDRVREAGRQHRAYKVQRREQPSPAAPRIRTASRHSRFWSLVHVRHAHG